MDLTGSICYYGITTKEEFSERCDDVHLPNPWGSPTLDSIKSHQSLSCFIVWGRAKISLSEQAVC